MPDTRRPGGRLGAADATMKRLALVSSAALLIVLSACRPERVEAVLPPGVRVDTLPQQSAREIDVLWVVDNSGSMAPRQELLAANFNAFIGEFTRGSVDYRLAVTDTDVSRGAEKEPFRGNPLVITPRTRDLAAAFANNIKVGTAGSPFEAGMEAARLTVEKERERNRPLLEACAAMFPGNPGARKQCEEEKGVRFLRPNAFLYIIFVTDEEDKSDLPVYYYWRYFETVKGLGNDGLVTTAAILGEPDNQCGAAPGLRYIELSGLTGGEVGSICDATFVATLQKLAANAVGLRRRFGLQSKPDVATLQVRVLYPCDVENQALDACVSVDREQCSSTTIPADERRLVCEVSNDVMRGWTYEENSNSVFFNGNSTPFPRGQVELQYCPEEERVRCGSPDGGV